LYVFFWVIPRRLNSDAGEENIQHSQHGESLKSRITNILGLNTSEGDQKEISADTIDFVFDHIQHKNKINGNVWELYTEGKNCDK
jgi:hypothetical protein